ncbi:hypothetical protein B0H13DRAFT_2297593 [Mycena leptocephala]|nr:hypothetical protein B0H13DRAFT_2297593 [Mycena leptocephala]
MSLPLGPILHAVCHGGFQTVLQCLNIASESHHPEFWTGLIAICRIARPYWTEGRHTRPHISTEHPIYFFPSPFFVNVAFEWLRHSRDIFRVQSRADFVLVRRHHRLDGSPKSATPTSLLVVVAVVGGYPALLRRWTRARVRTGFGVGEGRGEDSESEKLRVARVRARAGARTVRVRELKRHWISQVAYGSTCGSDDTSVVGILGGHCLPGQPSGFHSALYSVPYVPTYILCSGSKDEPRSL